MPISVRKAVEADIPIMGALDVAGYRNSAFRNTMFPPSRRVKPGDGDALEWFEMGAKRSLDSSSTHYVVAVEQGDKGGAGAETVVGMAIWASPRPAAPTAATEEKKPEEETKEEKESKPSGLPSYVGYEEVMEANKEIEEMLSSQDTLTEKKRNDMWTLNAITVDEGHRRKGVGKALVQWGIDKATEDGKQVWLIATTDGKKLYDSMGFSLIATGSRCGDAQHLMQRISA